MRNNKKWMMKNDVDKKSIFTHKIHKWLNFALNNLSKLVNIFNVSSSQKLEKIENEMTHWFDKNWKQFDHTNVNWKNWTCKVFACL